MKSVTRSKESQMGFNFSGIKSHITLRLGLDGFGEKTALTNSWPDRIGTPEELKENCVKKFT
jgi:hypothetical protein